MEFESDEERLRFQVGIIAACFFSICNTPARAGSAKQYGIAVQNKKTLQTLGKNFAGPAKSSTGVSERTSGTKRQGRKEKPAATSKKTPEKVVSSPKKPGRSRHRSGAAGGDDGDDEDDGKKRKKRSFLERVNASLKDDVEEESEEEEE